MDAEKRRVEYLAKAAQADVLASKARDGEIKSSWEAIAASYRELAILRPDKRPGWAAGA